MDETRIRKRLALIDETAGLLSDSIPGDAGSYGKADRLIKDATERRLQVISEAELDILKTLYKDLGRRIVGDEESLIDSMEGLLGRKATASLKERRGLRNKLVHAYLDIDQAEVYEQASGLGDLKEFARAVTKLVDHPPKL